MQSETSLNTDLFPGFENNGENLTIVILSFNRVTLTLRLINSILRCMPDYQGHILIADNGSSPEQLELLEQRISAISTLKIDLVKYGENKGVARGRNDAMAYVKTSWVLSLDNDIYLVDNPLDAITKAIKMLGAFYINVPLLKPDGQTVDAYGGDLWIEPYGNKYHISGSSSYKQISKKAFPQKLPFLSTFVYGGASVFYKDHFLKFGGYDTNMFVGFEDTELSLRLYKEGIKIGNIADFCFVHAHDVPVNDQDAKSEKIRFSADAIKKSGEYFMQKHGFIVWQEGIDEWIKTRFKELSIDKDGIKQASEDEGLPQQDLGEVPQLVEIEILKREVQRLQHKVDAMESSKFWALRKSWFAIRKKFGIANEGYSILDKRAYQKKNGALHSKSTHADPYQYEQLLKDISINKNATASVLIFIPFMVVGGAETAILQVIKGLNKNNVQVSLIATDRSYPEMGDTSKEFAAVCPDYYFLEDYAELWNDQDYWKHWKNLVYEIIKSRAINNILISNSDFAYAMLKDIKTDFPYLKIINPVYSTVGHMIDNIKEEKYIDLTVVENPKVEDYLVTTCQRPASKVLRIENGVDTAIFKNTTVRTNKLNNFTIPSGKKIVTFLGRLSEEKGPDIFVEIAAALKQEEHIHFLIAGGGPMSAGIIAQIDKHGIHDSVTFIGYANAIEVLAATDILVVPSRMDGRPNVVLESLSMGVPVICSDAGGLPWLISAETQTGYCLNLNALKSFEKAILQLCNNEDMYQSFSKASRKFAEEKLDVNIMQKAYARILNKIKPGIKNKDVAVL